MNMLELIRQVGRKVGDVDQIVVQNQDIFDWVNAGQLDIATRTLCLSKTSTAAASTFPVAFPSDFVKTIRILYGTVALQMTTLADLDALILDVTQTSTPYYYYERVRKINLYPLQPNADATTVTWDYVYTPTTVTGTGIALDIPTVYHDDLVSYCVAMAQERLSNNRAYEQAMSRYETNINQDIYDDNVKETTYSVIRDDPWEDW